MRSTIEDPETRELKDDGTIHYIKAIKEYEGRYLRVVVNPNANPHKIITLFFDRRIRRSP